MPLARGIYYPVVTPFDKERNVDHETFVELIEFGVDRGVHGVFALGSAGQGPVMDIEQRKAAIETAVETVDGEVPVVAHIGEPDADRTIELARHAESVGADTLALLPPYYYSDHSDYEIHSHFERVANAVDLGLMIYNNPKYAGIDITPDDLVQLVEDVPSIEAIKSSFDPSPTLVEIADRTPDSFRVFAGMIEMLFPLSYHGIDGSVNPPTGVFPEVAVDFWGAIEQHRFEDAIEYQRQLFDLSGTVLSFVESHGRGVYPEIFALRGITVEQYPKWETPPMTDADRARLRNELEAIGLGPYIE